MDTKRKVEKEEVSITMFVNYVLFDKFFTYKQKSVPIIAGSIILYAMYGNHKSDWSIKETGRCDQELIDFGRCLEKYGDDSENCKDFLEAYRRCLQKN